MSGRVSLPGTGRLLPQSPVVDAELLKRIERDYERFADGGLPADLESYLLDEYQIDVASEYAGIRIPNPWGKASGQLSMTLNQVREDVDAGLGFVVLKTVIAQDAAGDQSMDAWAVRESRMDVERITSPTGDTGWTVTWKGRGWWDSFEQYLELVRGARQFAADSGTLIVPSCKYHLPAPDESTWRTDEYDFTTMKLLEAWHEVGTTSRIPMPLEKDFSPTLAGSDLASAKARILDWLREVPQLIRQAAASFVATQDSPQSSSRSEVSDWLVIGLKVFNAMFEDEFQIELLESIHSADGNSKPDFFIYGNRLFNPDREFAGYRGVAYGGPELSDRNLRVMNAFASTDSRWEQLPWSATGDICNGRTAVEYALHGATSFQLHTFFQLPASEYRMKSGSRTQRSLHELYFHPTDGFVAWMRVIRDRLELDRPVRLNDVPSALPLFG